MPERALDELLDQAIAALLGLGPASAPVAESSPDLEPLMRIARALRDLPEESLQTRLKEELQRRANMPAATATVTPVRKGFRTVTPFISVTDGDRLIQFLKRTFGAEETGRDDKAGDYHAEVRIGDSMLMIHQRSSASPRNLGGFHVYVPDCDAAYKRAMESGAEAVQEPSDRPYGERLGFVKDFAGNQWFIATRKGPSFAPEGLGTVLPFVYPPKARAFIDFAKRAFGAEEMDVVEDSKGRVMHAAVRIGGDSVIEMGEPDERPKLDNGFFLYVDDCEAWYRRALAGGATSVLEPYDAPYGRAAAVADPFGHFWGLCTPPVSA